MAKAKREIIKSRKLVDAVIEVRDSRIARSSANPEIDDICQNKPRLILLNKNDLSDDRITDKWINHLSSGSIKAISINSLTGSGVKSIKPALSKLLKDKYDRLNSKGIKNYTMKVLVLGIPNVGKSSLINRISKSSTAKVGNKPGVTKSNQWIKTSIGIWLLDTPGILWPKFNDKETALNLSFTGAISDEILNTEDLALELLKKLSINYSENIKKRYKLEETGDSPIELMDNIAKARHAVTKGGEIDYNRISNAIINDFRSGKLGKISLEEPAE